MITLNGLPVRYCFFCDELVGTKPVCFRHARVFEDAVANARLRKASHKGTIGRQEQETIAKELADDISKAWPKLFEGHDDADAFVLLVLKAVDFPFARGK